MKAVLFYEEEQIPSPLPCFQEYIKTSFWFYFITGPFNQAITSFMLLKNPTEHPILFKIKTTAPKRYCVRPNSGLLEPNHNLEVASKLNIDCFFAYDYPNSQFE